MRACNALVLKLDYLSTTVCQKLHFLLSDAILRILSRASCACPRTLRVSAHISREDTQDGVSVGGFKMAAMSPVQLYIGQWVKRPCDIAQRYTSFVIINSEGHVSNNKCHAYIFSKTNEMPSKHFRSAVQSQFHTWKLHFLHCVNKIYDDVLQTKFSPRNNDFLWGTPYAFIDWNHQLMISGKYI